MIIYNQTYVGPSDVRHPWWKLFPKDWGTGRRCGSEYPAKDYDESDQGY